MNESLPRSTPEKDLKKRTRTACRARSNAEFISKVGVVEEETDESVFWIEMLVDTRLVPLEKVQNLLNEGGQLTAIWVASINTARGGKRKR